MACRKRWARSRTAGFTMVEVLIVLAVTSIIAGIAASAAFYAFDVSRVGKTVNDMRAVSSAIMKYEADFGGLPGGGLQPVSNLAGPLVPYTGGNLLTEDGWGSPLFYEPVVVAGSTTFRVYSYGKGGVPDGAITGNWLGFFSDVVVEGGTFIQTKW